MILRLSRKRSEDCASQPGLIFTQSRFQSVCAEGIVDYLQPWPAEISSGGHAFVHPAFEQRHVILRPVLVATHAPIFESRVNLRSLLFDLFIGRKIETVALHCLNVGASRNSCRISTAKLRGMCP